MVNFKLLMGQELFVQIAEAATATQLSPPPGDPRLWDALRQKNLSEVKCRATRGIYIRALGRAPLPAAGLLQFWLGFPGLQKITVENQKVTQLALQVRSLGYSADPLETVLREKLCDENLGLEYEIWTVQQFNFEHSEALASALRTLVSLGVKSSVFHPSFEEARVVVPGDAFEWPLNLPKVEKLQEAYQDAYLKGFWSALHRNYRVEEVRPRAEAENRSLQDPLNSGLERPASKESRRNFEEISAPLTLVAGLPNHEDARSSAGALRREVERTAALLDRSVGAVHLREHNVPLMSIETFSPLPVNRKSVPPAPAPDSRLYMVGPWDARNALVERRVESWVREPGREDVLGGELVGGEQDLILYFTRIASREAGWSMRESDAQDLILRNARKSLQQRAWFFWSKTPANVLIEAARARGVPFLSLGVPTQSGSCEFTKLNGDSVDVIKFALLKSAPNDIVEARWAYPEIKSPTYGFDKAAVFPDRFLLHVTAKSSREREWSKNFPMLVSGARLRSAAFRRKEANALPYFRWTEGRYLWGESVGTKEGWSDMDPRAAGAAAVDSALRGLISLGAKPGGGLASLWLSQPIVEDKPDRIDENSRAWGAYILALEGALAYLKSFDFDLSFLDGGGTAFLRMRQEVVAKLRAPIPPKTNFVVPGFRMVGEVLYAIGPRPAFVDAGSRILPHVRVVSNHTMRLNPTTQLEVYNLVHDLMLRGKVTCIRPVSEGGIVQALGEMALWGGLGAQIRPNLPVIELFSAAPGRFIVGILPSEAKSVETSVKSEWLTPLGLTGGEKILGLPLNEFIDRQGQDPEPEGEE
ncbi:MAG: hypothetical protein JST16_06740 [Bdellovibrionales bacterium]|nr:hypothetical protein [Bdellovibrionales bacterium]